MSTNSRQLGKYELQEILGRGPMTEVWKAFDTQQNRYVAIKFFHPQLSAIQSDPDFVASFLNEARVVASLHHPNIVQIHDFQVFRPPVFASLTPCVEMDYIEGQTLADYIKNTSQTGRFPPAAEVVRLLHPISAAMDYAHQRGIVHNDIKPTNILLAKPTHSNMPQPLLTDFGMMQLLKVTNWPLSNASYISPEQAQGYVGNERSDLYSLGVMLYELFTGTLPFDGDNPADTISQHMNATPTPPALINPSILPAVTAVLLRSLAKDPAVRYPSAGAMISSLARALNISIIKQPIQLDQSNDTMNGPTYITSDRPVGMTPSSPTSPIRGNGSVPPPIVSPAMASIPPEIPGNGMHASSILMTPALQPDSTSRGLSSMNMELPTLVAAQGYPAAQLHAPITPMPPTYAEGRAAPNMPQVVPVPPPTVASPQKRRKRGLFIALIALLIIALLGSGVGTYFIFFLHGANPANGRSAIPIVGNAFFISSGLLSANSESSQGITDQLQINLQKISPPPSGKVYYAWLLNDITLDWNPIRLGMLALQPDGSASLTFPGDSSNLLATNSRLLITREDASALPPAPSLDPSNWLYYAAFSQKPNPLDTRFHYSLYDHIRHLLAAEPGLNKIGLAGGLDIWLYRNTEKILEWSGSARDAWKGQDSASVGLMRRQLLRILTYLDGTASYQKELPGAPLIFDQTDAIAQVGLLEINQQQSPPAYLYHIDIHLHDIAQLPETSSAQKTLAIQVDVAIGNVNTWLHSVHDDALQLYKMTDEQLLGAQGQSLLNDLATQANNAFVGQIDPYTHQVKGGVVQIHYNIQRLATFDIRACTSSDPCTL